LGLNSNEKPMMESRPRKALFVLLDAMRFDVMSNPRAAQAIAPNLARLAERGFVRKCIANAQSTQFVLPSIFTQTYPLDYGGYNDGIRHRPKSIVELFKDAGFETHMMSSSNQVGVTLGYDRGFDTIRTTTDYRTLLEQRISRTLDYELALWRREGDESTRNKLIEEFDLLLRTLEDGIASHDKSLWPRALKDINQSVASGCEAERALLHSNPELVFAKLERIPAGAYWKFLGQENVGHWALFRGRIRPGIAYRLSRWAAPRFWVPFFLAGHYQVKTGEIIGSLIDFVRNGVDRQWYVHMHAMDVHDCRFIDRLGHILDRLTFLPRWWRARRAGLTKRRWTYDTAVMCFDRDIGKLFDVLETTGQLDDTAIVVAGDHGYDYACSPRGKKEVGLRTYREDIEAAMILVGPIHEPEGQQGLLDSMGVSASFLAAAGIPPHESYKGKSVFAGGRDAVVSESAGGGNADLARRDIFMTVTTRHEKLMTCLAGSELKLLRLFDLDADPGELHDLLGAPDAESRVAPLVEILKRERGTLLEMRGALNVETNALSPAHSKSP
jgi:hypothetical protein